jgi:hypothetical protein
MRSTRDRRAGMFSEHARTRAIRINALQII